MLGKLIKYEFKATARTFGLMYAALLLTAAVSAGLEAIRANVAQPSPDGGATMLGTVLLVISGLMSVVFVISIIAVVVLTLVMIAVRIYRLFGDQGYLWFTLPATGNQHLFSKLIVSMVWFVASVVMTVLTLGLYLVSLGEAAEFEMISRVISQLAAQGYNPGGWLMVGGLLLLLSGVTGIMSFYAAAAIGPNLAKSRLGGSVLAYLLIYVATQIVSAVQVLVLIIPLSRIELTTEWLNVPASHGIEFLSSATLNQAAPWVIGTGLVGYLVISVTCWFLTHFFMTRRLNLA